MSVQSFRERAQAKITEEFEAQLRQLRNVRWANPNVNALGGVSPSPSTDDIAMLTVTFNARMDMLQKCSEWLDDVFKELTAPAEPQEEGAEDGDGNTEEAERGGYG